MSTIKELLNVKNASGEPVSVDGYTLTPQSQAITFGGSSGGVIWNRPLAVVVEQDGKIQRLPIIDVTRIIQIGLFFAGVLFSIIGLTSLLMRKDK